MCSHANYTSLKIASLFSHTEDKDEVSAITKHMQGASEEITTSTPWSTTINSPEPCPGGQRHPAPWWGWGGAQKEVGRRGSRRGWGGAQLGRKWTPFLQGNESSGNPPRGFPGSHPENSVAVSFILKMDHSFKGEAKTLWSAYLSMQGVSQIFRSHLSITPARQV